MDTDLFSYKPRWPATTRGFGAEWQPLGLLSLGRRARWAHWQPFGSRCPVLQSSISPRPLCHSPTTGLDWLVSLLSGHRHMRKRGEGLCDWSPSRWDIWGYFPWAPMPVDSSNSTPASALGELLLSYRRQTWETSHQGACPSLTSGWACDPSQGNQISPGPISSRCLCALRELSQLLSLLDWHSSFQPSFLSSPISLQ